ncbi:MULTISPECIES: hypothetical protein [Protofrankia]|uniref:hypothetical protein n=1 Tax=Protofrankia TaxID=2994361 RepID=UPI001F1CB373|nr:MULTISPECIES: hypothetical protein [Protofrankia]
MTRPTPARGQWTAADVRGLGVITDVVTAGSVLDIGPTKTRELVRAGRFPVPVIRHGERYVVPVRGLLDLLGVSEGAVSG